MDSILFHKLADSLEEIIFQADEEWQFTFLNAAWERHTGFKVEDTLGKPLSDFLYVLSGEKLQVSDFTFSENEWKYVLLTHADGAFTRYKVTVEHSGTNASPAGVIIPYQHIPNEDTSAMSPSLTVEQQKQINLQAAILRNVSIMDSIILTDSEGNVIYLNDGVEAIFGYTKEEMQGESLSKLYPEESKADLQHVYRKVMQGEIVEQELPARHKDGREIWVAVTRSLMQDKEGKIEGVLEVGKDITPKKQAELRLKESREKKFAIINALPDLLFYVNKDGVYLEVFAGNEEELLLPKEELLGKSIFEVMPAGVAEEWKEVLRKVLETGELQTIIYELYLQGKHYWFEGRTARSGKDHAIVLVRNITEEVEAEKRLKESEEKYRLLAENALDVISLSSISFNQAYDSIRHYVSPSVTRILGYIPEELININKHDIIHPDDQDKLREELKKVQRAEDEHKTVLRVRHKNGQYVWMESRYRMIRYDVEREVGMVLFVSRDISEQVKAEQALKHSEQQLKDAQQVAGIGSYELDLLTGEITWSEDLYRIIGVDPSLKQEGLSLLKMLHPEDKDAVLQNFYQAIEEGRDSRGDYRVVRLDGMVIHMLGINRLVFNEEGKAVRAIGIIQDITERKNAEKQIELQNEELRKVNHELDNLIYISSHDLRSPLASAMGLLSILRLETDPVKKEEYLILMEKCLQRLDKFTGDILDLYKNTRSEPQIEQVDFREIVEEILDEHHFSEGTDKIEKIVDIEQEVDFYSESKRLKIIFSNLISNAIRYHNLEQPHPFLKISGRVNKKEAILHVQDNGKGIENIHQDRIFEMFYRVSPEKKGSGLGLYLVKETVEKLQGSISISSVYRKGTTFTITLPNLK